MRKIVFLITGLLMIFSVLSAQSRVVTGKVLDETGTPVPFATITEANTTNVTTADANGYYTIRIQSNGRLLVSSTGFQEQSVSPSGSSANVSLIRTSAQLSEVVVTALGIRRERRSLGYATQTIGSDELNKSGTGNPLNELSGKASGLTVINSAGDPGAGTYLLLRGATSITGSNQPLMVIDGVPIDNSSNNYDPQFNGFQAGGANADLLGSVQPSNRGIDVNPNDIESITVLKGPAATALYGIQAASGAIVITTKKGASGRRGSISFNSSVTFDKVSQLPPLQRRFSQGDQGKYQGPSTGQPYSWGALIDTLYWDGTNTNRWDKHGNIVGKSNTAAKIPVTPYDTYDFFKTGITYDNNVALSGSSVDGGSTYRMSLGNISQTGIIPKSKYVKTTFSLSGQSKLSDKLSASAGITYINSANDKVQQGSNTSGLMLGLTRTAPTFDNSNGLSNPENNPASYMFADGQQRSYRGFGKYDNPYWTVNKNPYKSELNRFFGYGQAIYQLADWISFNYRLGGDVYSQNDKNAFDVNTSAFKTGAVFLFNYFNSQFNSDFTVNLKKTFNQDFSGSLLIGHNYFQLTSNTRLMKGIGLNVPAFLDISNAQTLTNTESLGRKRTMAYYADAEFTYRRMLYLTLTGRQEESSTLPAENNTFFYPSGSLGWVFTELNGLKGNVLNFGKFRASIAQVGKDAPLYALTTPFSSPFAFTDGFVNNGVSLSSYGISTNVTTIGNPNLKPEKTVSYEGGLDLGFWKDRVTLNATVYYSKSTDVIIPASVSYTTGFAGAELNAATLTNRGVELTLNTTPISKTTGLRWDLGFNWSHNLNKVVSLAAGLDRLMIAGFGAGEFEVDAVPGQPYGVLYGNTTPHSNLTDLNSPLLISDIKGAGYGQPIPGGVGPNMVIGNPTPKWISGIISNLSYKNLAFGFQINVRHGGDIINGTRGALAFRGLAKETENRGTSTVFGGLLGHLAADGSVVHYDKDGITELPGPGTQNTIQSVYDEDYWQGVGNSVGGGQDVDVEDGSYVKIRQVSLTYTLPSSVLRKIKFSGLSITVFGNNLHTWTKYDGVDPETSLSGPSNAQGMDFFNNPSTRSYGVRLNLGL